MLNSENFGKYIVIGLIALVVLVIAAIGWTIANPPSKEEEFNKADLKAKSLEELGRNHITDISGQKYNSNPPSSGSHFPLWAQRGVYEASLSDGYLIHSLEHGYIILSYNCGQKGPSGYVPLAKGQPLTVMQGDAKDTAMRPLKPETTPDEKVALPDAFNSPTCNELVTQLSQFLDTYQRVIIIPRPALDTTIALTAWGKIDKMETYDKNRINAFIASYHNKGPERTVE